MASHPSRDEMRSELRRQKLPRAYVEHLLAELDDHYEDLLEERSTSMGAARKLQVPQNGQDDLEQRLGEPAQLALFAAEQYHARSFWGRHPWVTFLVVPLPMWVASWIACWLALAAIVLSVVHLAPESWRASIKLYEYPWTQAVVLTLICWYVIVIPPLSSAWSLCRIAQRNSLDWRWPALGCSLLAIVAALFNVSYRLSTEPNNGMFTVGFDLGMSFNWLLLKFLPKFAAAMGIGLLLVKRAQRQLQIEA